MIFFYGSIAIVLFYVLLILPTQWLKIERVQHPLGLGLKIMQISDLHVEMLRISAEKLRQIIEKEKPDFIFLTGDFTRNEQYIVRVEQYLKELARAGVPMHAVLGNHDYKVRKISKLLQVLERNQIDVLRNECRTFEHFQLVGIDDFNSGKSNVIQSFKKVDPGKPVVVITHDPNVVPQINTPFDYLMAGHLHGKQFNIPFFFIVKRKGVLPSKGIYKGFHRSGNGPFYISKGIGQAGINARLFVRSEITMHNL